MVFFSDFFFFVHLFTFGLCRAAYVCVCVERERCERVSLLCVLVGERESNAVGKCCNAWNASLTFHQFIAGYITFHRVTIP